MEQIKGAEFKAQVLEADTPVLVDFSATWCGPCRMLEPILKDLEPSYAGKIKFVKVDIGEAEQVATDYAVNNVPTLMIFNKGEVVDQKLGLSPKPALDGWLKSHAG